MLRNDGTAAAVPRSFQAGIFIHLLIQNKFIYYWDYGGYWTASYTIMKSLFKAPLDTVKSLYSSVLNDDYNNILPMVVSVPLKIFGYTFPRYVVVNYLLFLVPAWAVVISVIWKALSKYDRVFIFRKRKYLTFIYIIFLTATFSPFYYAMLLGYIDVACLIPSTLAVLLFADYSGLVLNRKQLFRDVLISLCLLTSFLFRRYFAYFVVGYMTTLFLHSAYQIICTRRLSGWMEKIRNAVINFAVVGGVAVCILLLFFKPLVVRILTTNYSKAYEGYNEPLFNKINNVIYQLGPITFVLAGIAIVLCLLTKKFRMLTLFCAVSTVVTTAAFFHVQSMGYQHIYTIAPSVFILEALGTLQIIALTRKYFWRLIVAVVFAAVLGIGAANCFLPTARKFTSSFANIYAQQYHPLWRSDIDELHHLADYVNSLTEGTDDQVYVCASGSVLNWSIMDSLNQPYSSGALHNMCLVSNVDSRDGFSANFLSAKYIIVTDPVQTHLAEGTQETVRFPNQEVQDKHSPIGRHFVKLEKTFTLDDNVKAYIYQKKSDFEEADLQYLADYYSKLYPGEDDMFANVILNSQKN